MEHEHRRRRNLKARLTLPPLVKLIYMANIRMPSEKAHVYQIMQMCEAFVEAGADVTLWHARRFNTPELRTVTNAWQFFGVAKTFGLRQIFSLDFYPFLEIFAPRVKRYPERIVSWTQLVSFTLALALRARPAVADVFYSRDSVALAALAFLRPRLQAKLVYEAHEFPETRFGIGLRRWLVKRVRGVVVITHELARLYREQLNLPPERLHVAPDGVRLERFADLPSRAECRTVLDLPEDAFVAGYVGQLHLRGKGKGVETLVDAFAHLKDSGLPRPLRLCVVGGPPEMVEDLRAQHQAVGLPDDGLVTPGRVHADDVPRWMRAFDVCVLPSPWTTFFAFYTSPLKLFEYMASGSAIVATDLPAFREIIQHEVNALLVPPDEPQALADALHRLATDSGLRDRLARRARTDVEQYTWQARAQAILAFAEGT